MVRAALPTDVVEVLELWRHARSAAAVTPDTEEAVTLLIGRPGSALLVAEVDQRIVGSLIVAWDGWRGNMYRLAVLPSHRRRGVARRLVEAGHEHLRTQGARRVTALVAHAEAEAVGVWLNAGYARDEEIARFVRNL